MKSKRPAEEPEISIIQPMPAWQAFLVTNSTRILLALTLVVLGFLILRYRNQTALQRSEAARVGATRAQDDLRELRQALELSGASPELIAARREQLTQQIMADLTEALADSSDSDTTVRADAYATRGDLYWTLANAPVFAEAATRPALATKESPDTLLSEAAADYQHVVDAYPNEILDWSIAQLGLAAIAENRSDFTEAAKHYQAIQSRTDIPDVIKTATEIQSAMLKRLSQPILVGPYPATAPTTVPMLSLTPATSVTTMPALKLP
jgi:tetratricopeptide (TPR) repeat protein